MEDVLAELTTDEQGDSDTALQTVQPNVVANDNFNPLEAEFERFHENNPHVYELFKKFTAEVILAGWGTTQLRRSSTGSGGTPRSKPMTNVFKMGQNHAPHGRLFMKDHPN